MYVKSILVNGLVCFIYLYLAQAALDSIDIMETPFVAIQRKELAEREEEEKRAEWMKGRVDEERAKAVVEWERKREHQEYLARQHRERAARKRSADERLAREMEAEEKIKKQTLLPYPPASERIAGIPLTAYDFQRRKRMKIYETGADDETTAAFMRDKYTIIFIAKCSVNVRKFKERFVVKMCGANELYQWCHDQMYSESLNAAEIVRQLEVLFGIPANQRMHKKKGNYKYVKVSFQEMRAAFLKRIKTEEWIDYDDEDNLFTWFRTWFCDEKMGAVLCHRANLVLSQFQFSSEPCRPSGKPAEYQSQSREYIESSLET